LITIKFISGFIDTQLYLLNSNHLRRLSRYYSQMRIRGIRGATQLQRDSSDEMSEAVAELLTQMLSANQLRNEDLISVILTATPDLTSDFPAVAARKIGLGNVPLLCAVEINVPSSLPRVVRVLMHANLDRELDEVKHVYLRGATVLRKDLAQ
jgi:chorismate mutase